MASAQCSFKYFEQCILANSAYICMQKCTLINNLYKLYIIVLTTKKNQSAVQWGSNLEGVQTQINLLHMRLADLGVHTCTGIYIQLDHVLFNRDFLNEKASQTSLPNFFIVGRPVCFINNVNL